MRKPRLGWTTTVLLLSTTTFLLASSERICERQGTCKRCDGRGRFSYYACQTNSDCFREERCRDGFCCPKVEAGDNEDPNLRLFAPSFFDDSAAGGSSCPDGSFWMRLCKSDLDCLFNDEICAQGKCCSSCIARRRQMLSEHPPEALIGMHVPQCSADGRFYELKQCVHGFPGECFCVSLYGQRVTPSGINGGEIVCGNSLDGTQVSQQADHYLTIGQGGFTESLGHTPSCKDPTKEWRPCMTACQVTCDTRTQPKCPFAGRCRPGCQCRLPYILESSADLENSRCVLPAKCPLTTRPNPIVPTPGHVVYKPPTYPFSEDNNDSNSQPHGAVGYGVDRAKQMHCSDPLKNFLTCGSACPAACDRLVPSCSFQCVSGCFCRTPYVLSDMNNANSACILPQHCEPKNPFPRPDGIFVPDATLHSTASPTTTEEDKSGFISESTEEPVSTTSSTTVPSTTTTSTTLPPPTTDAVDVSSSTVVSGSVKCADADKEFLNCGSSCPLACDNLDSGSCTPCVGGCFCRNGFVFEHASNWSDPEARCVKVAECPKKAGAEQTTEPSDTEAIGAQMFAIADHREIGRFTFSTAVDQKIRFDARISVLPPTESKTFVLTIHKYGALAADVHCEAIGDVLEINPVYSYPYPNGTLLYLRDVTLPYSASYTFQATSEFAARSVGAVIGRSLALHAVPTEASSSSGSIRLGKPLGCATIGILKS